MTKPTIVKTTKAELLLVVVPDDATQFMVDSVWPDVHESIDCLFYSGKYEPLFYNENNCVILPFPCELIGPLKDITEEQPTPEKYGFHNSTSFDDASGWMFEGGEDKYYEALELWEYRQAALSTGLKGNVIILKRTS